MDFIKFNKSLFDLNFKSKNEILQLNNKNIRIAFNMNGCFGNIKEIIYGIGNQKLTEFLYTNHFEVYCFETDKECISYFESFKNDGVDINIHIGPEEVLFEKRNIRFTKTGKPKKDKIEEVLNPKLEEFFNMPKIDLTIMNPPYSDGKENKNIDLKIISLCVNLSHKCVAIAPSAAITDFYRVLGEGEKFGSKADYNNKANAEYKNVCETNLKEFINVSTNEANEMFGTTIQTKMAIFVFNDNTSIKPINTMDLVEHNIIFDKIVKPLYNNEIESIISAAEKTKKTKFGCELREHHGNDIGTLNYYNLTAKVFEDACFTDGKAISTANGIVYYYVKTKNELINFFDYVNSPVIKYIHSLTKTNMRTRRQFIPDFGDYKQHITYKMIVDKFGINGYISDTKAKKGSEWDMILKAIQ